MKATIHPNSAKFLVILRIHFDGMIKRTRKNSLAKRSSIVKSVLDLVLCEGHTVHPQFVHLQVF